MRLPAFPALLLGVALLAASPPSRAEDEPAAEGGETHGPPSTDAERDAWNALGLEGRWVEYRAETKVEPRQQAAWRAFLAASGEVELLEWSALYEGWPAVGGLLVEANAPQWMRTAIWALASTDSHSFENAATMTLETKASHVLAYVERFPEVLANDWLRRAVATWKEKGIGAGDASGFLPPHTPDAVYAHLDAPARLATFTPGSAATAVASPPATRYVHQVTRAMSGLAISNHRPAAVLQQLERLLGHPSEAVRHAACLTYVRMPEALAPSTSLLYRAGDERESERVREAALFAFGRGAAPSVFARLLTLVEETDHPAWRVAVARLVDKRDPYVLLCLDAATEATLEETQRTFLAEERKRLQARLRGMKPEQHEKDRPVHEERAVWLKQTAHPHAEAYTRALEERKAKQAETPIDGR